jgi:hypothetical protein
MRLPLSQHNNVNNKYIVGNSVPIISSTEVQNPSLSQLCVVLTVDHLFPYQVTRACVRTDPPPSFT